MPADTNEPYCGNCGYQLSGLTESSKCPECGKPLVEVLSRSGQWGRRFRSQATLFGQPVVDVAFGPVPGERVGHARGIIAIGDKATGWIAIGGMVRGIVAIGGFAIGLFSVGGFSLGLIAAWGGMAAGLLADGGLAIGLLAAGGLAVGWIASGGVAVGQYVAGGAPIGQFAIGPGTNSAEALAMFDRYSWFFGPSNAFTVWNMLQPIFVVLGLVLGVGFVIGLLALVAHSRTPRETFEP